MLRTYKLVAAAILLTWRDKMAACGLTFIGVRKTAYWTICNCQFNWDKSIKTVGLWI